MRELRGRVAVVTGAASGIGNALSRRFAAEGMKVVLADIEEAPLKQATEELRAAGAEVVGVRTDVADPWSVLHLADVTLTEFGAVHVVCNNAGVGGGTDFARIPLDTWEWVLGVDLWGVIHGCRTFLPLLQQQDEAHIVNTSSMAALNGHPLGLAPYTVAKFGVLGLSQNLFFELSATTHGRIGVSVLVPGLTQTRIFDSDRNRPSEVTKPEPSSFARTSQAMITGAQLSSGGTTPRTPRGALGGEARISSAHCDAMAPDTTAGYVLDAIREQRFYILPHPEEALDMAAQQLRWMRDNIPLEPGPGVARTAD